MSDIFRHVYRREFAKSFPCHTSKQPPRFAGFWPKLSACNSFHCHRSAKPICNSFVCHTSEKQGVGWIIVNHSSRAWLPEAAATAGGGGGPRSLCGCGGCRGL